MNMKKKPHYTLVSLLIVLALAVPMWSTVVMADDAIEIHDWQDLHNIRNNLSGSYILVNDLDSTTDGYGDLAGLAAHGGKGWEPIGTSDPWAPFTGSLDGQGYEIRDLFIDRDDEDYVGIFGVIEEGSVANIRVIGVDVTGYDYVGGLVGDNFQGSVSSSYSSGTVSGNDFVGGLAGISDGIVSTSSSTAMVDGENWVGGLLGSNGGNVSNCYAAGSVTGYWGVGGLVGDNWDGTVSNCYSTGSVTGDLDVGGMVGWNEGAVGNSFWDIDTSGMEGSDGGAGKTTAEMMVIATFVDAGWDIVLIQVHVDQVWYIDDGSDYPRLGWEMTPAETYALTMVADPEIGGTATDVTDASPYEEDAVVQIKAEPAAGYRFVNWTAPAGEFGDAGLEETTFTMPAEAVTVTANFELIPTYALTMAANPEIGGTATDVTDESPYAAGTVVNILAIAGEGYEFTGWTAPAGTFGNADEAETTLTMPAQDVTVTANFAGIAAAEITGQTREVNCVILPGVTVRAYLNGVEVDSAISDGDGNYVLEVAEIGDYQVVASREGFIAESQAVSVTGPTTTVDFISGYGLIPEAPGTSYVLACISLWKTGDPPCHLNSSRVLAVISVWKNPILED